MDNVEIAKKKACELAISEWVKLDVAFDGADELTPDLTLIKGGGGCLVKEKIVASCASTFIVLVDERKLSSKLGTNWKKGVPIEVVPLAGTPLRLRIEKELGGSAILRQAKAKMGPLVTDNGNFIIDWIFDSNRDYKWKDVETQLLNMPGIVGTGLFIGMTRKAYVGQLDGSVKTYE